MMPSARHPAPRPRPRAALVPALLAALLVSIALPARAAVNCTVTSSGVVFGSYDTFSSTPLDGTGPIQIVCNGNPSFSISLSTGGSGSYAPRAMASGSYRLNYNLYTDAARTTIWGNGTGGTQTVSGTSPKPVIDATVYGRIPARQNAAMGNYSDTVTVTVTF